MRPRNVGRTLLALILPLIATLATAAPVTVTVNAWWSSVTGANFHDGGGFRSDSSTGYNMRPDINWRQERVTDSGTSEWASNFSMDTAISYDEASTHLQTVHTSDAFAEVDAGVTGINTRASAGAGLTRYWVEFLVLEPVIYTGTNALYFSDGNYDTDYFGDALVTNGMILQPGYYSNRIAGQRVSVDARAGQSAYDSVTETFDFGFDRVPVPVPATFLLVAGGLLGFGAMRRTARKV